jgi:ribosomal protein S27AE
VVAQPEHRAKPPCDRCGDPSHLATTLESVPVRYLCFNCSSVEHLEYLDAVSEEMGLA